MTTTPQTIAFVGLGNMGGPMAANLVRAGHSVRGFDLAPASLETAKAEGIGIVGSVLEAVDGAAVVVTMLPAGRHVIEVWSQVVEAVPAGTLLIDSSTVDVASARQAHALAEA
ncbi:3-hydroxyisobutyrate dehydrogenase, partial [Methylobacterium sp. WL122]